MLMDGDPSPIASLEDDALTLEQCAVTFTRCEEEALTESRAINGIIC